MTQIKDVGVEKLTANDSDLIPIQEATGLTGRIKKSNLIPNISSQIYPTSFSRFQDESKMINGSGLTSEFSSTYPFGIIWYTPGALNNSFEFNQLMAAGTYNLSIFYQKGSNRGDLKLEINNVLSFNDLLGYQSGFGFVIVTKQISIPSNGLQNFKWTIFQKQPYSTGYNCGITRFSAVKV